MNRYSWKTTHSYKKQFYTSSFILSGYFDILSGGHFPGKSVCCYPHDQSNLRHCYSLDLWLNASKLIWLIVYHSSKRKIINKLPFYICCIFNSFLQIKIDFSLPYPGIRHRLLLLAKYCIHKKRYIPNANIMQIFNNEISLRKRVFTTFFN